jgi:hypothetical protein
MARGPAGWNRSFRAARARAAGSVHSADSAMKKRRRVDRDDRDRDDVNPDDIDREDIDREDFEPEDVDPEDVDPEDMDDPLLRGKARMICACDEAARRAACSPM